MQTLRELLAEALDLCVRARNLDDAIAEQDRREAFPKSAEMYPEEWHRCGTPHLWVVEQYDNDLADWETRAKSVLAVPHD